MRLRWPFRPSGEPQRKTTGSPSADPAAPEPEVAPTPFAGSTRASRSEWQGLDAIERASGPAELTADEHFGRVLAGYQPLPPVLQDVASDAGLEPVVDASGLAGSAGGPRRELRRGPELTLKPAAQRAARRANRGAGVDLAADEPEATTPEPQRAELEPEAVTSSPLPPASVPNRLAPAAVSTTAASAAPASAAPAAPAVPAVAPKRLTMLPASDRRALVEATRRPGLLLAKPPPPGPQPTSATDTSTLDTIAASERGTTDARLPGTSPQHPPLVARRRPNLGESRRAGLGAPLAYTPPPDGEPPQASAIAVTAEVAAEVTAEAPAPEVDTDGPVATSPTAARHSPDLVHRDVEPHPEANVDPISRSVTPTGSEPIPLQPALTLPRLARRAPASPAGAASTARGAAEPPASASVSAPGGPVSVDRSEAGAVAAMEMDADAFAADDTIVIPSHHGPLDEGRGQQLLAHELIHVAQQRSLGPELPAEDSSAGQLLERQARAAEATAGSARVVATPAPALTLAHRHGRKSAASATATGADAALQVAQPVHDGDDLGMGQLEAMEPPHAAATTSSWADTAAQRSVTALADGPEAGAGAGAEGEGQEEADLDEMARQLYERLRLRLRRELILDRERGGCLTDMR